MDYQIIIISQNYYEINKDLSTLIIDRCTLEDSNSLTFEDEHYYFEYLIIDDLTLVNNLKLELDGKYVITNYYQETSVPNVFAIGDIVKTKRTIDEQLSIITDYIIEDE